TAGKITVVTDRTARVRAIGEPEDRDASALAPGHHRLRLSDPDAWASLVEAVLAARPTSAVKDARGPSESETSHGALGAPSPGRGRGAGAPDLPARGGTLSLPREVGRLGVVGAWDAGARVTLLRAEADGAVVVGTDDGRVTALDPGGHVAWQAQ